MSARAERITTPEAVEAAETMGRRTHEAITGMATNLLAVPEFTDALARDFFRRSHDIHSTHSRNEIPSVYFQRGGFGYLVEWASNRFRPIHHDEPERTQDLIRSGLTVTKYDPREQADGWHKKIAKLSLETDFMEGENGEILRFVNGSAKIEQDYDLGLSWEDPKSWRTAEPTDTIEDEGVFDKIPEAFGDIRPGPATVRI